MNILSLIVMLIIGYSIVMLWRVSLLARERGNFLPYLPFFLWAIFYSALGAFIFYEMQFTFWWFLLDFAFFISYALLLLTLAYLTRRIS